MMGDVVHAGSRWFRIRRGVLPSGRTRWGVWVGTGGGVVRYRPSRDHPSPPGIPCSGPAVRVDGFIPPLPKEWAGWVRVSSRGSDSPPVRADAPHSPVREDLGRGRAAATWVPRLGRQLSGPRSSTFIRRAVSTVT
jgi:hypothetical protein